VKSPEEALEDAYLQFRAALEAELLEAVTSASPAFIEELVVDLCAWGTGQSTRCGFGGRQDRGRRNRRGDR
jgi:restriction endonuclease Mrr